MSFFCWPSRKHLKSHPLYQEWVVEGFRNCVDGYWIWQNNQFYVSSRIKKRLGYSEKADQKFTDANWWKDFVHEEDKDKLKKFLKDILNNNVKVRQIEIRIRHYHGHWVWFLIQCHIGGYHLHQPQVLGTFSDVSSYRLLHDQLERIIEELENNSQEKNQFISHLNHEIRTPIQGILGSVSQLKETPLTDVQQEYIKNITSCADLLLSLVNEVLDLSKIAAGKLDIDVSEFELNRVIQQVINMLSAAAQQKNIQLVLEMDKRLPHYIKSDSLRLQQILLNLLKNAIKFTDKGKVTLEVSLPLGSQPIYNNFLLFRVIDTGHGIAKDVLPSLFQDFTQASKSTARSYGGTGLGLSICRKLVALMGGEIGAQSTLGKGSIFWFKIPVQRVTSVSTEVSPSLLKEPPLSRFHILVVEDNLINQQVLGGFLTSLNQSFLIAQNGWEAIELFQQHTFDLIFMDINMPLLDGLAASEKIRSHPQGKEIPIFLLTADTHSFTSHSFNDDPYTHILFKPVTKEKLIETLKTCKKTSNFAEPLPSPSLPPSFSSSQEEIFAYLSDLAHSLGTEPTLHLIDLYLQEGSEIIEKFSQTPQEDFYNLAHTLAGISENLGIKSIGQFSRQLMNVPVDADPFPLVFELTTAFNQVVPLLHSIKDRLTKQ